MAGTSDNSLVIQVGYPDGVNNVSQDQSLPRDENGTITAARSLVNVDLRAGKPSTRQGYVKVADGRCHSPGRLKGRAHVDVCNGDLVEVLPGGATGQVLRAGVGERRISYAEVLGDLWWSNGEVIRRLRRNDLVDVPIGPACPGAPDAEAYPTGGLAGGNYSVAATWFDAEGRESGAWGSVDVEVAEGQGIRVFGIPAAPETAVLCRIYVSPPGGGELYAAKEVVAGVNNTLINAADVREATRALEVLWHEDFPPCTRLRWWNGRLFGVVARNTLIWSPALRPQLHHPDAYMRRGVDITLFEPLANAGAWLCDHAKTYWLQGTDPARDWRCITKYDAAAQGASIIVPGTVVGVDTSADVAFWISTDGVFSVGMPDGTLVRLKERQLRLPQGEEGAILLREHEGLRSLVMTYLSRGSNGMALGDRAIATVTRYSDS